MIISIKEYKERKYKKKESDEHFARGREPLYVSHLDKMIRGSNKNEDFGSRLQRIRASLDKINKLMAELKRMNNDPFQEKL